MSACNIVLLLLKKDEILQQEFDSLTNTLTAHVIAAISPQVAAVLSASELIKIRAEELAQMKLMLEDSQNIPNAASEAAMLTEYAVDAVLSSISNVKKNAIELLTPSLSTTQLSINQLSTLPVPNPPSEAKPYSAIVQQHAPPSAPILAALICAATRECQILFEPAPGKTLFTPNASLADIATKMKMAFSAIQTKGSPTINVKATIQLHNGRLIILKIIEALDLPTSIKERRFSIIIPFLLISSDVEDSVWLWLIEEENDLSNGAIESAHWIKPKLRRAPNQTVAHAIFHFADSNAANMALQDGIYINKEKLHP
ncbi:uncharacterized protein HD556DRAFT_1438742 [Suillus plorans]|uniref:Uncharacterized protein n=1 Tax=Suillus plorans TaxID=116603 RepID=A0A9P7J3C6_9AGAM|nr:uncharacterized protein HD556DRAFT_1438742 [Suillus plorans]KAG1800741.1 hypothetical protein HD556DRAFT_1438742 [Suillus plorans]